MIVEVVKTENSMDKDLRIFLRKPKFPVLVISNGEVYGNKTIKELWLTMLKLSKKDFESARIFEANGHQLLFKEYDDCYMISPAFITKLITKKQIVDFYNNSSKGKQEPFSRSLSVIKFDVLFRHISDLARKK